MRRLCQGIALIIFALGACSKPGSGGGSEGGETATLSFSESTLLWSLAAGEQATRTLTISSEDLESPIEVSSDVDWLVLSQASGASPLNIVITVDTMPLDPGDYAAHISALQGGVIASLDGALIVGLPALRFSPRSKELALARAPATGSVTISATRGAPAIALTSSESWLTMDDTSMDAPGEISLTAMRGERDLGEYLGSVTATADGYQSALLDVTMNVTQAPEILALYLEDGATFDLGQTNGLGARLANDIPIALHVDCPSEEPPYDGCNVSGPADSWTAGTTGSSRRCINGSDEVQDTVCVSDADCAIEETCEILIVPPMYWPGVGSEGCALGWVDPTTPLTGSVSLGNGAAGLEAFTLRIDGYGSRCPACIDPESDGSFVCERGRNHGEPCTPRTANYSEYDDVSWDCLPYGNDRQTNRAFQVRVPALAVSTSRTDAVMTIAQDSPLRYPEFPDAGRVLCGVCTEDVDKPCTRDADCIQACTAGSSFEPSGTEHSACTGAEMPNDVCTAVDAYSGFCSNGTRRYCSEAPLQDCWADPECFFGSIDTGDCIEVATPCLPTIASGRVGSTLRARNEIVSATEVYIGTPLCLAPSGLSGNASVTEAYDLPAAGRLQLHMRIEQIREAFGPRISFADDVITLTRQTGLGGTATFATTLAASEGTATFALTSDSEWLTSSAWGSTTPNISGNPRQINIAARSTSLAAGVYTGRIDATAPGYNSATVIVEFTVTP